MEQPHICNKNSDQLPVETETCLMDLTNLLTKFCESFENEVKSAVGKYDGLVANTVSNKTKYLLAATDSGDSEITKVRQFERGVFAA